MGTVVLYGAAAYSVRLSRNYSEYFNVDGLVCDWKGGYECRFDENLERLHQKNLNDI